MKLDIEKILNRAEERLRKLPEASGEETLNLLRGFLRMESHRLRMLHRYGVGGLEVAATRSRVVDAIITHVYRLAQERYSGKKLFSDLESSAAIVAVGGYGRGELCPYSDVDLLILYDRTSEGFGRHLARELVYLLWDINLKVGHSFRTAEQCIEMSRADSSAENALIDARYLVGGRRVFDHLRTRLQRYWAENPRKFVERKQRELAERYGKLGETVFLLEPNTKESPGGLRDFHTLSWLARGAWQLEQAAELVQAGVLSAGDYDRARRGYDWILRVRNELHYVTGRRADQLTFTLQPEVAQGLKFVAQKHQLASEVFMRQYFLHAENVHQAMRQVVAAAQLEKGKRGRQILLELPDGLHLIRTDGELRLADVVGRRFPSSPLDMVRVYAQAQKLRLRPGEDIQNAVRSNLPMVSRSWQRDLETNRGFLKLLRRPGRVGLALRAMHSSGLLGKYLPEFGHVTRLMQYDYYHRYTTDEHTLHAIDLLDEIWSKPPAGMEHYRDLTYHITDPAPLYLGLLLHDIGKGLGGGHSAKGAQRAMAVCERLGLEPEKRRQVEILVRQHLLLSHLSQRRDLSDRRVAQQAAEITGDLETLSMLTLLTYADTAAVGPEVWTDWKNWLLWELHEKVHLEFLGLEAATAQEEEMLQAIRQDVEKLLLTFQESELWEPPGSLQEARLWIEGHLALLPHRYPLGMRPELIARQIVLARRASGGKPAVALLPVPDQGYTVLLLCCPDTRGLFAKMAGTLASLEVNILGARLDTCQDGMAVDMLWISTPRGDVIEDPVRLRRIGNTLEGVLQGSVSFDEIVQRIDARPLAPALKPPKLNLNNEISDRCTVLEILAEDRLGFAYSVAKRLTGLGLNIVFAKLATEKTMAFDVFYLTESEGGKLAPQRCEEVLTHLEEALHMPSRQ
ncbi:MAG: [protein-PII] uridylyltransferase [Acidobacteria bacterium]|nr:[protein-PII] uridylyltransferase [Acidobacteriota bacterium]